MRTLILDSSYLPIGVVSWQKAMVLLLTSRAQIVEVYQDVDIRSPRESFKLPKILRLFGKFLGHKEVRFTRFNVFYRDGFSCLYCDQKFPTNQLTFDHVIPMSKGGKTCWENIVTCCHACNGKKGNRTLNECGMRLVKKPHRPKWTPELCFRLKPDDPKEWFDWIFFGHAETA